MEEDSISSAPSLSVFRDSLVSCTDLLVYSGIFVIERLFRYIFKITVVSENIVDLQLCELFSFYDRINFYNFYLSSVSV